LLHAPGRLTPRAIGRASCHHEYKEMALRVWRFVGVFLVQLVLLLAHWFVYSTCLAFWPHHSRSAALGLGIALLVLAFTFVTASLLSFRVFNQAVALFYKLAAIWLGFMNYFFMAACLSWPVWFAIRAFASPAGAGAARPWIAGVLFALAAATGFYGLINARWIRVRRVTVDLPKLPESWRGRKAVMLSDLHLGQVNGRGFCRRLTALAAGFNPDIVFLSGDVFDGVKADLDRLVAPLRSLKPPFGIYFSTGNHEEFGDATEHLEALHKAGVRILANECVTVDGLQIAGIRDEESSDPARMQTCLEELSLDEAQPSILLNHAPIRLHIVEEAGVSLQLSGHTHGGQMFPITWVTHRVFGKFTYGMNQLGALKVYTSSGAGTWGPPMRVGSQPEVVHITFR
jgi:uncharacterized protein